MKKIGPVILTLDQKSTFAAYCVPPSPVEVFHE